VAEEINEKLQEENSKNGKNHKEHHKNISSFKFKKQKTSSK
jgi:hypothetical protein